MTVSLKVFRCILHLCDWQDSAKVYIFTQNIRSFTQLEKHEKSNYIGFGKFVRGAANAHWLPAFYISF